MSDVSRREALGILATVPLAVALETTPASAERAMRAAHQAVLGPVRGTTEPTFFNAHEWRTLRVLVDLIIPRDERSGSATDAGVPEFIDFMVTDRPSLQIPMRGGLHWLDTESRRRFGKVFADCKAGERTAILDDIAWPAKARPEMSHGVAFFNRIRDLTASGFWTSRIGFDDLQYTGNVYVQEWNGCPPAALEKLGVSYGDTQTEEDQ